MFQQLATLLITRQVVGNVKEAFVPYIMDKFRLLRICVRAVEAMSPDTLQRQMSEFDNLNEEGQDWQSKGVGTSEEGSGNNMPNIPSTPFIKTEKRRVSHEEIDIVHSGLTLSQAEVEAAMKRVRNLFNLFIAHQFTVKVQQPLLVINQTFYTNIVTLFISFQYENTYEDYCEILIL